ncbi:MAG TPA: ABC transporter ATP-binding protein [Candidatus Binatia bacterium]|nr:ABC transporter ATP-binding protein [Candidatus Binatia bacterium]
MSGSSIELHDVTKTFDRVTVLDRISCTVEAGEVVGLLGPNGSGKTTLLRLLCAYFPPTSGSVRVAGYDTRVAPLEVRRRVGYALEGVVLYPDLTVSDFLSFVKTVKKTTERQLDAVVHQCGLAGWLHRRLGTLSKGYRQRVVLAQALLGDPPVLILDEPTAGMDPEMAVKIRGLITTLAGSRTVLLSTHSLAEAHLVCQRVMVLYQGRLLARGTPQELFSGQTAASTLEDIFLRLVASHASGSQQSAIST